MSKLKKLKGSKQSKLFLSARLASPSPTPGPRQAQRAISKKVGSGRKMFEQLTIRIR
jgi:hypothetical protein